MMRLFKKYFPAQSDEAIIEQRFENWLEKISKEEKVEKSIIGFNFGLFESEKSYMMYLIGSSTFDKENDDWATEEDFEPQKKYFDFGPRFSEGRSWEDILQYAQVLITNYIRSDKFKNSILSNANAITTGFDAGNLKLLYFQDQLNRNGK